MKTFEVAWNVFKQYMVVGDTPIMAVECEEYIKIYQTVSFYEICYVYVKVDPEQTIVFKQTQLDNPRVIYPFREVNNKKEYKVTEINGEHSYSGPRPGELQPDIRVEESN